MESSISQVYAAEKIFTGNEWLADSAVIVDDGKISDIIPSAALKDQPSTKYHLIAPAFIDIQIYGAHDKLLSVYPETDSLYRLYDYCSKGGASHFQPTVATNTAEVFHKSIDAVRAYWKEGGKGCLGLHIEGPWIHPLKKGAHLEQFIHSPSVEEAKDLLEYGKGVITMITLAPEVCSREVIELIRSYGIIISAGHSNATYDEATAAFDSGIQAATHLYNAMSPLQHRALGMVGAIFDHATVMTSLVPDGFHVDFSAIRIAKKILKERLFVITDAVTETNAGPYQHHLTEDKYEAAGILSGSALTMAKSLRNLVDHVGIELDEALRMVSLYPAQVMKKADSMGRIAKGYDANLVILDELLEVNRMIN
ncbi:MAG: N-acetylglucosamine-6-phosphate deacetylase [Sediminibacterium sp.]|nr:N-acetylglucosamine-6-phosphate deacetylase [Sediminibacterium sp.]